MIRGNGLRRDFPFIILLGQFSWSQDSHPDQFNSDWTGQTGEKVGTKPSYVSHGDLAEYKNKSAVKPTSTRISYHLSSHPFPQTRPPSHRDCTNWVRPERRCVPVLNSNWAVEQLDLDLQHHPRLMGQMRMMVVIDFWAAIELAREFPIEIVYWMWWPSKF